MKSSKRYKNNSINRSEGYVWTEASLLIGILNSITDEYFSTTCMDFTDSYRFMFNNCYNWSHELLFGISQANLYTHDY